MSKHRRKPNREQRRAEWRPMLQSATPGVAFFLVQLMSGNMLPFIDDRHRTIVFREQLLARQAAEWAESQLSQEERALLVVLGVQSPMSIVVMGQEKWELFQKEQDFVTCDSLEAFKQLCRSVARAVELDLTQPDRN